MRPWHPLRPFFQGIKRKGFDILYGDKSLPKYLENTNNKSINSRSYKSLNLPYFITRDEFIKLRYEDGIGCDVIAKIVGYEGHPNSLRRQAASLGWRSPVKTFSCDEDFFKQITSESAWVLGWLITDGYISDRYIKLDLQKRDTDVLVKIKRLMKFEGNIYESKLANGIKVYSKTLVDSLVDLGIPLKEKTFSCAYPNVNKKFEWDFIRGAFEGDGSIVTKGSLQLCVNICGASPRFINGVNEFLLRNGILTRIEHRGNLITLHSKSQADALRWLYFMYANSDESIRMDRKFTKYVSFVRNYYEHQRKSDEAVALIELARQNIPECSDSFSRNEGALEQAV